MAACHKRLTDSQEHQAHTFFAAVHHPNTSIIAVPAREHHHTIIIITKSDTRHSECFNTTLLVVRHGRGEKVCPVRLFFKEKAYRVHDANAMKRRRREETNQAGMDDTRTAKWRADSVSRLKNSLARLTGLETR